jgi:cyanophycin synthetase
MVNKTIILIILIIIVFSKLYIKSKEPVIFSATYLTKEYKKNNILYDRTNKLLIKDGKKLSTKTQLNKPINNKVTNSKYETSKLLHQYNIPVPNFTIWDPNRSNEKNIELINKLKYPLVVKPVNGVQGKDVYLDLYEIDSVLEKVNYLLSKNSKIIIEEQITGENFRILLLNNNIIDIVHRKKPSIIGNGKHNIKDLIFMYNSIQKKHKNFPITNINYSLLDKQGLTLDSIPKKGQIVRVSNVCNYHNGSRLARIPIKNIHPDNLELFKKINVVMGINLSGIDYISPDISKSYKQNNGNINEVNSGPSMKLHHECDSNNNNSFAVKRFVSNLF